MTTFLDAWAIAVGKMLGIDDVKEQLQQQDRLTPARHGGSRDEWLAWWASDAARDNRVAKYIFEAMRGGLETFGEPDWPALRGYDIETDQPMWRECSNPTTIKDYLRAVDGNHLEQINVAARELIKNMSSPADTEGKNRAYHCEMMLAEIVGLHLKQKAGLNGNDTRSYLSLDLPEQQILIELLEAVTGIKNYILAAGPAAPIEKIHA